MYFWGSVAPHTQRQRRFLEAYASKWSNCLTEQFAFEWVRALGSPTWEGHEKVVMPISIWSSRRILKKWNSCKSKIGFSGISKKNKICWKHDFMPTYNVVEISLSTRILMVFRLSERAEGISDKNENSRFLNKTDVLSFVGSGTDLSISPNTPNRKTHVSFTNHWWHQSGRSPI